MTQREDSFVVYHRHEHVLNTKLPPAWITHRVMRVRRILPVPARNNAFRLQRLSIGCCSPGSNTINVTFSLKNALCENNYRFTTDPWFLSSTGWLCRTPFSRWTNTRQEFFVRAPLRVLQRKNIVRKHLLYGHEMLNEILTGFNWILVIAGWKRIFLERKRFKDGVMGVANRIRESIQQRCRSVMQLTATKVPDLVASTQNTLQFPSYLRPYWER